MVSLKYVIFEVILDRLNQVFRLLSCFPLINAYVEFQLDALLLRADRTRKTAATKCNASSSRSHAVFTIYVEANNSRDGILKLKMQIPHYFVFYMDEKFVEGSSSESILNLVDLAGSERAKESGVSTDDERFSEMKKINHSLTSLQMCIRAQHEKVDLDLVVI